MDYSNWNRSAIDKKTHFAGQTGTRPTEWHFLQPHEGEYSLSG